MNQFPRVVVVEMLHAEDEIPDVDVEDNVRTRDAPLGVRVSPARQAVVPVELAGEGIVAACGVAVIEYEILLIRTDVTKI